MLRNKILVVIFIFLLITISFFFLARQESKNLKRDSHILFNQYYALRNKDKEAAKEPLQIILKQEPNNTLALEELSQLYVEEKNLSAALPLVQRLIALKPNAPQYRLQMGALYYELGDWAQAHHYLLPLANQNKDHLNKFRATQLLEKMASFIPNYQTDAITINTQVSSPIINIIFLNWFYKLKQEDKTAAESLLTLLCLLEPTNPRLNLEMAYLKLQNHRTRAALPFFLANYHRQPTAQIALQIAYLYYQLKDKEAARHYFLLAAQSQNKQIRATALKSLTYLQNATPISTSDVSKPSNAYQPKNKFTAPKGTSSHEMQLLDNFYTLKKQNKRLAWQAIKKIVQAYPNNVLALKEAGYLAIELKQSNDAIVYFTRVYELTYDPAIAMQLGYLYNDTPNKNLAYRYFELATKTSDKKLELNAQNALTNLAGLQTKALPPPYFGEFFFTPFTQSRFGLTVRPMIARLGLEFASSWQPRLYLTFRRTDDNKSTNAGQLPQIFEDNVRITGVGGSITPFTNTPIVAWVEAGGAYDLVYRNRDRWRGDLRGGLMYYNEFGTKPAYYDKLRLSPDYYSTFYGDVTYYSRFDNNIIGTFITRQGIHILQYQATMINLYFLGRVIEDTRREFFNNIAEYGPGIGLIPSNRYRLEIRFDYIHGTYLPAGGSVNPYGKHYTNKVVQLLYYVKI
ncbi:tetratricopeptide repeat protein [Legionella sp. D16C41]|uniref:tetratricopeptide repeat protein n=1 Tax=Legionella sp. D16C41 TaxID=3402688 RepID=UPI003AF4F3B8